MLSNRYVALIDILGFSRMVSEQPLEHVVQKVQRLLDTSQPFRRTIWWGPDSQGDSVTTITEVGRYHFSDTIFLWTQALPSNVEEFEPHVLHWFLDFIANLLWSSLMEEIPLRGAIAFGNTFIDANAGVIVGTPILRAHELEQNQEWLGVAIDESVLLRQENVDLSFHIADYRPPLKLEDGKLKLASLDWTGPLRLSSEGWNKSHGYDQHERFKEIMAACSEFPEIIARKYRNLEAFARHMQRVNPFTEV